MNKSRGDSIMTRTLRSVLTAFFLTVVLSQPAGAALQAVGPISAANGFPAWYQDTNALQLELCLDPGMCLLEPPNPGAPISFPDNFGPEAFWWNAEAIGLELPGGGTASLILAMEAAFANENPAEGDQVAFARIRIDFNGIPAPGSYTVTHPYGQVTYNLPAGASVFTQDIGNFDTPGRLGNFAAALADGPNPPVDPDATVNADGRSIGPFLVAADAAGVPLPFIVNAQGTYIANPVDLNRVIGSPIPDAAHPTGAQNYFRVQGPGGTAETQFFTLMGKAANCGAGNLAPVAAGDLAAASAGVASRIKLIANDTDDSGVNPGGIVIGTSPNNGTTVRNADGTVTYTPVAGFTGVDSFTYTVQDFCGLNSNIATAQVIVEGMTAARAELRPRLGKWSVAGTSSLTSFSIGGTELLADLEGGQENPAVTSAAEGLARLTVPAGSPTSFDYLFNVDPLPATAITQAHIHVGGTGTNGPIIFFLCTNLGNAPAGVVVPPCTPVNGSLSVSGTLDNAALQARPEAGITTFADAIAAIRGGNAYVNVHTTANPGGEIRGQIGRNVIVLRSGSGNGAVIGKTEVKTDGSWIFDGKSRVSPGSGSRSVHVESSTGATATPPLRLR